MAEQFKKVIGNNNYSISNNGQLINRRGEVKTPQEDTDGYLKVDLYSGSKRSTKRIHRLVAEAFIPNPYNKPDINHKDGNKHNNSVANLEWVTKSENMRHAYQTGLAKPHASYGMLGHRNPNGGRKGHKVRIVETGEEFNSIAECACAIRGNDRSICDCIYGRQHTHRGYHFERI